MKLIRLFLALLLCVACNAHARDDMEYGRAYMAEGDPAAAARSFGSALKRNPFDAAAHNNLAVAKAAQGDYQEAMDLLARAAKLAPNRQDIRDNLNRMQQWMREDNGTRALPSRPQPVVPHAEPLELPALWDSPAVRAAAEIRPRLKMIRQLHDAP